ncbi:alanine--tRNA ligase [Candidatus Mycalebacterium sp.]
MTGNEIRETFLSYFEDEGHKRARSSPLIPAQDPTLLFTNAGMVQFKNVFLGLEKHPSPRAVSSQKCMRAGGKHNDLDNVGYTARHHTFFEMLGNFSFGDYFKPDAVRFAWDLMTEVFKLPKDKLWVTVYKDDDEAADIWSREAGLNGSRILRMGEESNFWSMGDVGPCGPCSEILIDQGAQAGCGKKTCAPGCDCDRYLELWNLVFMQYEKDESGKMAPLPRPSIDTGMGLERMAAVIQGAPSNYETDLLLPVISSVEELSKIKYENGEGTSDSGMRVVADHARAACFLICDGVFPSNEGRGYVLRRIIRRAVRHGKNLGMNEAFLFKTLGAVSEAMSDAYPELSEKADHTAQVVRSEEERFFETVDRGLEILESEVKKLKKGGKLSGESAFRLYDTYGFPLDLTQDVLRERGIGVDEKGFEKEMGKQKEQSRKSWKGDADKNSSAVADCSALASEGFSTDFTGYGATEGEGKIVFISEPDERGEVEIVTDSTPFYAGSGGQTGDTGTMAGSSFSAKVVDTTKPVGGVVCHRAVIENGGATAGDRVTLLVDKDLRLGACAHHTATHILHSVLRATLGTHVSQAGSLVVPDRLRFDFTHHSRISADELDEIESAVNRRIGCADEVVTQTDIPYDEALKSGAMAIFEEKYGDKVRVVSIGDYSVELCGGTHLENSAAAGMFKIISQSASSAGVRRIEAVCARAALKRAVENEKTIARTAKILGSGAEEIAERVEKLLKNNEDLQKQVGEARKSAFSGGMDEALSVAEDINGVRFVSLEVPDAGAPELREIWDKIRAKIKSGAAALCGERDGKAFVLVGVTKDLAGKIHAGNIVKEIAPLIGGKGGGKPELAQAGGDCPEGAGKAIEKCAEIIKSQSG